MKRTQSISTLILSEISADRKRIRSLLRSQSDISSIAVCSNMAAFLRTVVKKRIDLVFIDIQMAGIDSYSLENIVGRRSTPHAIFIVNNGSVLKQYCEKIAIDHITKPFTHEHLNRIVERLQGRQDRPNAKAYSERLRWFLRDLRLVHKYLQNVICFEKRRPIVVPAREIYWIEINGGQLCIHTHSHAYWIRGSLTSFELRLDPSHFLRIHRRKIVNIDRIKNCSYHTASGTLIHLKNGARITPSRSMKKKIFTRLNRAAPASFFPLSIA